MAKGIPAKKVFSRGIQADAATDIGPAQLASQAVKLQWFACVCEADTTERAHPPNWFEDFFSFKILPLIIIDDHAIVGTSRRKIVSRAADEKGTTYYSSSFFREEP